MCLPTYCGVAERRGEVLDALELRVGEVERPLLLEVDLPRPVDHDVADARILEEGPDGAEELEERLFEYFPSESWRIALDAVKDGGPRFLDVRALRVEPEVLAKMSVRGHEICSASRSSTASA